MKIFIKITLSLLIFFLLNQSLTAQILKIYTEELAPYNFTRNNKITGASTEIVKAVLKRSGFDYTIKIFPWTRSMKMAQHERNSFIYSINRLTKREKLYHWIGVLVPVNYFVYALTKRKDIRINKLSDMKKYKIGTTINDAREVFLISKGFTRKHFDSISGENSFERNLKRLTTNRIELLPMPRGVMNYYSNELKYFSNKQVKPVFQLKEISNGLYLAANLNTSKTIISKIRKSLKLFKKTKKYKKILNKWNLQ